MTETKNERFRRLASSRGDRLIREIALLGNLSNQKRLEALSSKKNEFRSQQEIVQKALRNMVIMF